MIETINQLRAWFTALKKPTQAQFWAVFDSFAHKSRDFDQMGGGLKLFNPARPYTQGEAAIVNGKIRQAKSNLPAGIYDANQWEDFTSNPASLGIPAWTPEEIFVFDPEALVQRTHRLAILEAIADGQGIEPFVDPDWEDYWQVVVYSEGGFIPVYPGGGFVKYNRVYEFKGSGADHGLYRCNRSDIGFDGGFKSTNFVLELAAGNWLFVSGIVGGSSSGTVTSVDGEINGDAIEITGAPITTIGILSFAWIGDSSQYVTGNGTLASFPTELSAFSNDMDYVDTAYVESAISSAVVGFLNDRGNFTPSGNYPSTGGSGTAGAIKKGNIWTISGLGSGVSATMGTATVTDGDVVRALVDAPGQTNSNWAIVENNFGYVAANSTVQIIAGTGLTGGGNLSASRTINLDLSAVVTPTGIQSLTNKTLVDPYVTADMYVATAFSMKHNNTGTTIFTTNATASAVNHLRIANALTGNAPMLETVGADTNVSMRFRTRGSGVFEFVPFNLEAEIRLWNSGLTFYSGFKASASMSSSNTYVLPTTGPASSGITDGSASMVSNTSNVLSWASVVLAGGSLSQGIGGRKTFSALAIRNSTSTFDYVFAGSSTTAERTITLPLLTANDTIAVLGLAQTFTGALTFSSTLSVAGVQTLSVAGSATVAALTLTGTTARWINFGTATGIAAPTFTTRSLGTKLVFAALVAGAAADVAIGYETNFMWFGASTTSFGFKWYGGTTLAMTLGGDGVMTMVNTINLAAGTATIAPLKMTAGTNLTTPVNGALEFDGTNLYFTVGGTRKTVTLV